MGSVIAPHSFLPLLEKCSGQLKLATVLEFSQCKLINLVLLLMILLEVLSLSAGFLAEPAQQ